VIKCPSQINFTPQTEIDEVAITKLPNGYGGVVKLCGKRRKPYAVRVTTGWAEDRQLYAYIGYFETRKEALELLAQNSVSPVSPKRNITLAELYAEWSSTPAYKDLGASVKGNYKNAYDHLEPLHKAVFADLRAAHFKKIIDALDRSVSTKQKIKVLGGLLYKYAMENDVCSKNYASFIKIKTGPKKKKKIFTDIEIETFFKNDAVPGVDTILILIYTGLRIGELLGLTKFSVDWKDKTLTGGLKTDAGRDRVVPISPKIEKYLRRRCDSVGDGPLFLRGDGKPLKDGYYRKKIFAPLLERFGMPRRAPHSTRHTCATLLAREGAETEAIKLILGHTKYSFTADTYTHPDVDFLREAMGKI
jgi:integrase